MYCAEYVLAVTRWMVLCTIAVLPHPSLPVAVLRVVRPEGF
jgi:hypothetical protein